MTQISTDPWIFDLEGDGLRYFCTKIHCGVFKNLVTGERKSFRPHQIKEMLSFMDTIPVLGGHNVLGYDFPVLKDLYDYEYKGTKFDTWVISNLVQPKRKRHSVESYGEEFGRPKVQNEDWSVFTEHMLHRCEEDVEIQVLIFRYLRKEMDRVGWTPEHFSWTFRFFEILAEMSNYGWLLDQELCKKYINQLQKWIGKIDSVVNPHLPQIVEVHESKVKGVYGYLKKCYLANGEYSSSILNWFGDIPKGVIKGPLSRVSFRGVDLNSNDEVKDYLLREGWQPLNWNYKKVDGKLFKDEQGNLVPTSPKLSYDDPFDGVNGKVGRLIAKRVQCRHRKSLLEGLLKRVRPDGRIQQDIVGIASTGRLKHSGIVNIPSTEAFFGKQCRKIFTSKEGYQIIGTDASGCQDRMLASRIGSDEYIETILKGDKAKGTHLHQVNQRNIEKIAKVSCSYKESKNANYAFKFGASDRKLGSMFNTSSAVGALVREALLAAAPGFAEVVERLENEWKSTAKRRRSKYGLDYYDGYITGLDGRPILIESKHQILVYAVQSDEAILMMLATIIIWDWLHDRGWKFGREWGIVAHVHDEFSLEVRDDLVDQVKVLTATSITKAAEVLALKCPQQGEAAVGKNWYEVH